MIPLALAGWLGCVLGLSIALQARRGLRAALSGQRRACHELRGALCAAQLGLELEARGDPLGVPRRRALELELGRAASVLSDLDPEIRAQPRSELDMRQLVADSVEAWIPAAQRSGVELRLSWIGPRAWVIGDRGNLARITDNLIANAIEHGEGPVEVQGWAEGCQVRIEIRDQGPGLPAPDRGACPGASAA